MKITTPDKVEYSGLVAERQDVWRGTYRDFSFKIVFWNKGASYTPGGEGAWCFYVYLPESQVNDFASLWLPDELKRFTAVSPERVSHDYMSGRLLDIELHGGITFYGKHGHSDGHRCVEVGCDYRHLWDSERGGGFTVEELMGDVKTAIDSLFATGIAKTAAPHTPFRKEKEYEP